MTPIHWLTENSVTRQTTYIRHMLQHGAMWIAGIVDFVWHQISWQARFCGSKEHVILLEGVLNGYYFQLLTSPSTSKLRLSPF